jgi:hypothetical protein
MNRRLWGGIVLLALSAVMTGCIAVGGNDHVTKPTLGRQLIDLKTARDAGAIDEQQYEQARTNLLNSVRA